MTTRPVRHLCRPMHVDQGTPVASERDEAELASEGVPLLNEQVAMEARGVISEPLFTGVPVRPPVQLFPHR